MSKERRWMKLAAAAMTGAAAGVLFHHLEKKKKRENEERLAIVDAAAVRSRSYGQQKAYIIGSGLSSLAAAVWLMKDGHFPGNGITIFGEMEQEALNKRPLIVSRENMEDFTELLKTVPSAKNSENSLEKELTKNGISWKTWKELCQPDQKEITGKKVQLSWEDIKAVIRLLYTDEEKLDQLSIKDWFDEGAHIFQTYFWQLCQTVFDFHKDSSLAEFSRSLKEIRGPFLQLSFKEQELLFISLKKYLHRKGVLILENSEVTDLSVEDSDSLRVKTLYVKRRLQEEERDRESFVFEKIILEPSDVCIIENGCKKGALWKKIAPMSLGFGAPESLFDAALFSQEGALRPHGYTDRPLTFPAKSRNMGFIGSCSRMENGFCLTGEYEAASARKGADELLRAGKWMEGQKEGKQSRFLLIKKVVQIVKQERKGGRQDAVYRRH